MPKAIILTEPETAGARVAGVTLVDRLVIAAHRAGLEPILVVGRGVAGALARSAAKGIAVTEVAEPPPGGPALIATSGVLVQSDDLARVVAARGRLTTADGRDLPVGVVERVPARVDASTFAGAPPVRANGVAVAIERAADLVAAERALWSATKSSADGLVDRWFNRPVGRLLLGWLVTTPVTPNQISVAAIVAGVGSGWLFAAGSPGSAIAAAIVLQGSAVLDCIDGDVARIAHKESAAGKWLDIVGDQVVHVCVFVGIGVGLWRRGTDAPVLQLGISAGVGVLLSFAIVLAAMRSPSQRVRRLVDATANRDFSVLLIALAVADRLDLFAWLAGIGVHVFWLGLLVLVVGGRAGALR